VPVHAFVEDVAASGGYWLACAADKIWADRTSILGSIGVISAGFGFHEAIAKIGVERRVHTAGESKSILDPFRPEKAEDVERLKALAGRVARDLHRPREVQPGGPSAGSSRSFSPARSGPATSRSNWAWPTASAISCPR
jgi:hypothetical protein